jgi:hypothetical protein
LTVRKPWATYTGTDPKHVTRRVKLTEMLNWESLFIPSRLSSCRSTNTPVGVNPHRCEEKVKLLLNSSHLEPQVVKPQYHHRDDDFGVVEVLFPEKHQAPLPGAPNVKVFL